MRSRPTSRRRSAGRPVRTRATSKRGSAGTPVRTRPAWRGPDQYLSFGPADLRVWLPPLCGCSGRVDLALRMPDQYLSLGVSDWGPPGLRISSWSWKPGLVAMGRRGLRSGLRRRSAASFAASASERPRTRRRGCVPLGDRGTQAFSTHRDLVEGRHRQNQAEAGARKSGTPSDRY